MVIQQSMQGLLPCNTLLPPLRVLITVTFSTPTPVYDSYPPIVEIKSVHLLTFDHSTWRFEIVRCTVLRSCSESVTICGSDLS